MELTPETIRPIREARAHRWELWLLLGLPFVGVFLAVFLDLVIPWRPLLPVVPITHRQLDFLIPSDIDLPFLMGIVPLILLVSSYRLVKDGDRPLLKLLWKFAIAAELVGLAMLLVITYGLMGTETWTMYLVIFGLQRVIFIGLLVAFGRAASRRGFKNALLFIVATGFLGNLTFAADVPGYSGWTSVMSLLTLVYGAALTLAAVWAVRWADANRIVTRTVVVIPLAALLLFLTTELAVKTALAVRQVELDQWTIGRLVLDFGVTLAGYLISAGLVYLFRIPNPAVPSQAPA